MSSNAEMHIFYVVAYLTLNVTANEFMNNGKQIKNELQQLSSLSTQVIRKLIQIKENLKPSALHVGPLSHIFPYLFFKAICVPILNGSDRAFILISSCVKTFERHRTVTMKQYVNSF